MRPRPVWSLPRGTFAPALAGLGTRNPVNIYAPNSSTPVTGYAPVRGLAKTDGGTTTVGAYVFDTVEVSSRVQVSGGLRFDRYDTDFLAVDAAGARPPTCLRPTA